MEKFSAAAFYGIARLLERLQMKYRAPLGAEPLYNLNDEQCKALHQDFDMVAKGCKKLGLDVSCANAAYIRDAVTSGLEPIQNLWISNEILKANQIVGWEMQERLFFSVSRERAKYYEIPKEGWEEIIERFPQAAIDVEESSRCFACDRYAAAIFHILLVAELGVIEVSDLFDVKGDRPGWGATERLIKLSVKKPEELSPTQNAHLPFLKEVAKQMDTMKNEWRHKITHVDNRLIWLDANFSPHMAEEIIVATRGFMRYLALKMPCKGGTGSGTKFYGNSSS